ncbi:MAG TPA: hypothetical protein VJ501_08550 [Burkholderiaceae bacterium]|nr:hypothetical protein [Burkholderiaceae bacterium]
MKASARTTLTRLASFGLLAAACVAPAHAQAPRDDEWRVTAVIYGWFPDIGGTTSFPTTGGGPSVDIDASKIIDNLKFAFMGLLQAKKGRWGAFLDYDYVNVSASKSATQDFVFRGYPVGAATADLNYDLKGNVLTLAGLYGLADSNEAIADVLFGARMLKLDQTLGWTFNGNLGLVPLPTRSGTSDVGLTNWDAIVGLKGRVRFGDGGRWYLPYYADIGTGQSKLTWQLYGGLGYSFGNIEVVGVWRYLDYEFDSDSKVQSLTLNGPALGIVFTW